MVEPIFSMYQDLGRLTLKMLDAARSDDWDELIEIEQRRDAQVSRIAVQDGLLEMTMADQEKTSEIIQQIMVADEEIKVLAEAWMSELQDILGSIGTEKKLHQAYEAP